MSILNLYEKMKKSIIQTIKQYETTFGVKLDEKKLDLLAEYCELVFLHNKILHLTAPMTVEEFVVRHVLESIVMIKFLPKNTSFADVGAGAGLPSLPCLIVRPDLSAYLIEAKNKKAGFLMTTTKRLGLENRVQVVNQRFEQIKKPEVDFITCRALDKFSEKLPKLLKWGKSSGFLLFGGENLRQILSKKKVRFEEYLLPLSERRFLFFIEQTI